MGIVALLRYYLTHEQMLSWGWRLPFYLGIVFGGLGLHLRLKLKSEVNSNRNIELTSFLDKLDSTSTSTSTSTSNLVINTIAMYTLDVILVLTVTSFWACSYYICCVWFSYFLSDPKLIGRDTIGEKGFLLTFGTVVALIILFPIAGLLADKLGSYLGDRNAGIRYSMILATILMIILILPAMYLLTNSNMIGVIFGLIFLVVPISLFGACLPSFMLSRFPKQIRYTSVGLSYNMSHAIFASSASMICMILVQSSKRQTYDTMIITLLKDSAYRPCYYLIFISVLTLVSLAIVTPTLDRIQNQNHS